MASQVVGAAEATLPQIVKGVAVRCARGAGRQRGRGEAPELALSRAARAFEVWRRAARRRSWWPTTASQEVDAAEAALGQVLEGVVERRARGADHLRGRGEAPRWPPPAAAPPRQCPTEPCHTRVERAAEAIAHSRDVYTTY